MKKLPPIDLTHSAHNSTTPHRKPTPRKAKRIKATIMWQHCYSKNVFKEENGGSLPVAVLDVSDEDALIGQAENALILACFRDNMDMLTSNVNMKDEARAVLESLGILKRKARK